MTTTYHAAHFTEHPQRAVVWRAVSAHLAGLVPAEAAVLEIGAGYCHWINHVDGRAPRGGGHLARRPPTTQRRASRPWCSTRRPGSAPLGEAAFDVVLASNVLEHFEPDVAAAVVARRRPGAQAGRTADPHPAEFPRTPGAATSTTTRTGRCSPTCRCRRCCGPRASSSSACEPRFLPYSMRGAARADPGVAGARLPALAVPAARRPDARRRHPELSADVRRPHRLASCSPPTTRSPHPPRRRGLLPPRRRRRGDRRRQQLARPHRRRRPAPPAPASSTEAAQGYGHALRRGLREATGDLVILAEPDGTFVGRDVLKLLAYADDFDMVCGTRTTRELIWDAGEHGLVPAPRQLGGRQDPAGAATAARR